MAMSDDEFYGREAEALQSECLEISKGITKTLTIFIPLAYGVYAVPFLARGGCGEIPVNGDWVLWSLVSGVSSLVVLIMTQRIFWAVDGVRKIGEYLRYIYPNKLGKEFSWEEAVYEMDKTNTWWPSDEAITLTFAILIELLAARWVGCSYVNGQGGWHTWAPFMAACLVLSFACFYVCRIFRWDAERKGYSEAIAALARLQAEKETENH